MQRMAAHADDQARLDSLNTIFDGSHFRFDFVQNKVGGEHYAFIAGRTEFRDLHIKGKTYRIRSAEEIELEGNCRVHYIRTSDGLKLQMFTELEQEVFYYSQDRKKLGFCVPSGVAANGLLVSLLYDIKLKERLADVGKRTISVGPKAAIYRVYRASMDLMFNI